MKTTAEMAREAGARAQQDKDGDVEYLFSVDQIERLLAAECEACAQVCDDLHPDWKWRAAESIRARRSNT